jgi:pilus assembly protein Flp/PilA
MSATFHLYEKGLPNMLKYYVKGRDLLERLRANKDGVVSFEYVVVAGAVVAAVVAAFGAFGGSTAGPLQSALTNGLNAIIQSLPSA